MLLLVVDASEAMPKSEEDAVRVAESGSVDRKVERVVGRIERDR